MRISTIIAFVFLFLFSGNVYSQNFSFYATDNIHNRLRLDTRTGEVFQIQDDGQRFLVHPSTTVNGETAGRYRLYKTRNMWTFILLDTFTGQVWQCQYSVDGDEYRSSWVINAYPLVSTAVSRFRVEPLTSMYQFYLIDDETGDIWKFQWSSKGADYRWIEKQ